MSWLDGILRGKRIERQLDAELRFHFDECVAEHIRRGMSEAEARRVARLEFGGLEQVKEECRDARGLQFLHSLIQDIRYALRGLRRAPGFTAVAVLTLALGIGIDAAVFTVTKAALFAGFPLVDGNDRILYLSSGRGCCVSYPDFEDWRAQARSFTGMAIVHGSGRILSSDKSGFAESFDVTEVSADTFRLVGRKPILGRDFTPLDESPGSAQVLMLTYGFWERRFGKDPAVVGRTLLMNGAPATVIGIMPPGFSFPQKQDFWVPLVPTPEIRKRDARNNWFAFGRLRDGATIGSARAEMEAIGRRLGDRYPLTNRGRNLLPSVQTFNEFFFFGNENEIYWSMWGAVGFVLLIACANLANLMLARAIERSREISVRIALGAGRWRIMRQLLMESLMLSGAGGAIGCWIARWCVRAWAAADRGPGRSSWRVLDYSMDYHVLGYLVLISAGTALLFGLAPARRLSKLDVSAMLKDGGRGASAGGRGKHLSGLLVIGEMALAVVLLAGAGVMIRSFLNIYDADLGVKTANVLTMTINLPAARYPGAEAQISFYERLAARLEALPGVESVAIARAIPTGGSAKLPYELADAPFANEQSLPQISALVAGPDYFQTLGARLLSGREFQQDTDGASGVPVAIVNQRFASQYWPRENPLGNRLRLFDGKTPGAWLTVVGVAPNVGQNGALRQDPLVYVPYRQKPLGNMDVMARTLVPPGGLAPAFRREVQAIDSELPIFGPLTLDERLEGNYWSSGLYGVLFLMLAAIALLLASVGLYALIAHSVSRRTQEIGIRMAVGATARDIRELVLRQGMLPLAIGLAVGLAASIAVNRVLKSALVEVSPSDPISLAVASATLVLSGMLGCLIPARRAMRVDPANAIRHE